MFPFSSPTNQFVSAAISGISSKAFDKGTTLLCSLTSNMDMELDRYELLAHPNPPNPVKAKAPPIGSTLTHLAAQLRQSREMLLNGGCTTSQSVQEMMSLAASAVEKSKGLVDDRLKETHASSVKLARLIDKVRSGRCAPPLDRRTDGWEQRTPGMLPELAPNMFQSEEATAALRRTVAQHLVRSGSLETAEIFARVRDRPCPR